MFRKEVCECKEQSKGTNEKTEDDNNRYIRSWERKTSIVFLDLSLVAYTLLESLTLLFMFFSLTIDFFIPGWWWWHQASLPSDNKEC